MQSVGTPDAVFLEENLVDDAWGQALRSRMSRVGTGPKDASDVARGDRPRDRAACHVWGQAPQSRDPATAPHVARGDRPRGGARIFYAFETQGGTAGHVGGALCHRHRVHCCMFRYWESLT